MSGDPKPLTAFQQSYHWRNKNCGPWAQDWVKRTLPGKSVSVDGVSAEISEVTSVSGDCDLGQRKGKLLTIYDLEIEAKWKGTSAAGDEVTGRLSIPEFSHEAADGLEATQFNWSADGSGKAVDEVYAVVRSSFPAVLEGVLSGFRAELLAAHGVFLEGGASTPASGTATPADRATQSYSPAPPGEVRAKASPAPKAAEKKVTKTTTVELTATMQASADDLWSILTDQARVPMWSRSAAKITPVPGTEYELFSGNVSGKIVSVDKPNKLVQTWNTKSPGWPADHYGTMTITLAQGSDSTVLKFMLDGVPVGKEGDIERALDAFYIRGLKQMGLVHSSSSRAFTRLAAAPAGTKAKAGGQGQGKGKRRQRKATAAGTGAQQTQTLLERLASPQVVAGTAGVGLVAVFVGLVASTFAKSPQA